MVVLQVTPPQAPEQRLGLSRLAESLPGKYAKQAELIYRRYVESS